MLVVNNVTKSFKDLKVLSNVTFNLDRGKIIHIKGSNGSGKSTLLKIISGLIDSDSGSIVVDKDVYIGAFIENPVFLENESALYNLRFLYQLRNKDDYTHIESLMRKFELDPKSAKKISSYSVGMRQKVGIIQAIMENQNLILLDEPTRGLDDKSIDTFVDCVNELLREKKSVIISSHDKIPGLVYDFQYEIKNHEVVLL